MNAKLTPHEQLPTYGDKPDKPGMYLGLLHGRDHPQQPMNDWGFNGPMIGPLRWFHTTYACTIRIAFESTADGERYFGEAETDHELELVDDLLEFDSKYYGDWTVYCVKPDECAKPPDSFRNRQRRQRGGHWAHSACID